MHDPMGTPSQGLARRTPPVPAVRTRSAVDLVRQPQITTRRKAVEAGTVAAAAGLIFAVVAVLGGWAPALAAGGCAAIVAGEGLIARWAVYR